MGPKKTVQTNTTRKNTKQKPENAPSAPALFAQMENESSSGSNQDTIALNKENNPEPFNKTKTMKKRNRYCPRGSRRIKGVCVRTIDGVIVPEIGDEDETEVAQAPTGPPERLPEKEKEKEKEKETEKETEPEKETEKETEPETETEKEPKPPAAIIQRKPVDEVSDELQCKTKRSGMNAFLAEKERLEYAEHQRAPLTPDDPFNALYPDLNDPDFHLRIADR